MNARPNHQASVIHDIDCPCSRCAPPGPAVRAPLTRCDRIAILTLTGVATGLAIIVIIDAAIGGPGLLAAFGF